MRALLVAAGLLAWSATKSVQHPLRHNPFVQAGVATALVVVTRARLGLRPSHLAMLSGVVLALAISARAAGSDVRWLAWRIPVGTVWSEELAYRGALRTVAYDAFGPRVGRLLQAVVFGLSHVPDARASGAPVGGIVLVTGAAGWVFAWLADRSGSVAAPMLAHLATNEIGAVAVLVLRTDR